MLPGVCAIVGNKNGDIADYFNPGIIRIGPDIFPLAEEKELAIFLLIDPGGMIFFKFTDRNRVSSAQFR